jgi:hypothetical protein
MGMSHLSFPAGASAGYLPSLQLRDGGRRHKVNAASVSADD